MRRARRCGHATTKRRVGAALGCAVPESDHNGPDLLARQRAGAAGSGHPPSEWFPFLDRG